MPKIRYEDWNPGQAALDIIATADAICRDYAGQGYDLTLRQLYYRAATPVPPGSRRPMLITGIWGRNALIADEPSSMSSAIGSLLGLPSWRVEIRHIGTDALGQPVVDAAGRRIEPVQLSLPFVDEQLARQAWARFLHDPRLRFDTGRLRLVLLTADQVTAFQMGAAQ